MDAYQEGRQAFRNGLSEDDNPYDLVVFDLMSLDDCIDWEDGWWDAEYESRTPHYPTWEDDLGKSRMN